MESPPENIETKADKTYARIRYEKYPEGICFLIKR
jgi:hypothetical protein